MKCVNTNCENIIIDFTGNTDGRCGRCRLIELFMYFGSPTVDSKRVEQTQVDKQELIDAQGYDQGGHYNIQTITERMNI